MQYLRFPSVVPGNPFLQQYREGWQSIAYSLEPKRRKLSKGGIRKHMIWKASLSINRSLKANSKSRIRLCRSRCSSEFERIRRLSRYYRKKVFNRLVIKCVLDIRVLRSLPVRLEITRRFNKSVGKLIAKPNPETVK